MQLMCAHESSEVSFVEVLIVTQSCSYLRFFLLLGILQSLTQIPAKLIQKFPKALVSWDGRGDYGRSTLS